jgi:hypothetical protein
VKDLLVGSVRKRQGTPTPASRRLEFSPDGELYAYMPLCGADPCEGDGEVGLPAVLIRASNGSTFGNSPSLTVKLK